MLLLTASLLSLAASFPFEITPQPVFPVPDPTPAEPCGLATRVCIAAADCASNFCNIAPGAATGCCQDTQFPAPDLVPSPEPFNPVCAVNVPLCITDIDCGHTGYCNHTTGGNDVFGCCTFGPSDGTDPFPPTVPVPGNCPTFSLACIADAECATGSVCDHSFATPSNPMGCCQSAPGGSELVTVPTPGNCPTFSLACIADAECAPGSACDHSFATPTNSLGCCRFVGAGVNPIPFPFPGPGPVPDPFPAPAPVDQICPASVALCIADAECGEGHACSHTASNSDVFGCCYFTGGNSADATVAPFPFPGPGPVPDPFPGLFPNPFPVVPAPANEICPASVALCIADAECGEGHACSHTASNSEVFGCCYSTGGNSADATVAPFPFPGPVPDPFPGLFPNPFPVAPAPANEICPASVALCIADAECGEGHACSHTASNSDVFGCCYATGSSADATVAPFPFPGPEPVPFPGPVPDGLPSLPPFVPAEQPRCSVELACLVDSDCAVFSGKCEYIFGNPLGCCVPN